MFIFGQTFYLIMVNIHNIYMYFFDTCEGLNALSDPGVCLHVYEFSMYSDMYSLHSHAHFYIP